MKKNNFFRLLLMLVLAASLGGLLSLGAYKYFEKDQPVKVTDSKNSTVASYNINTINVPNFDFSAVSAMVNPTVVHITTKITADDKKTPSNPFDLFEQYSYPRIGSGSGVIISPDGYIVTNNHVVADADEVEVSLYDKRVFKATVLGTDPSTDIAVIKVPETDLPAIKYGNSDKVNVGEWVLAVGNPFNLTSTVTAGIVSAKGRNINLLGGGSNIESFIQTDAAVNPGNSGGALVNVKGELIGINTAIASRTGQYAGYSFAVPVNIAKKVVDDIITYGEVQRGFIGVSISNVTPEIAKENNLDKISGVKIESIMDNSAAKEAGLKKDDLILEVNNNEVGSVPELQEIVGRYRPGDKVNLEIIRDGKEKNVEVVLRDKEGKKNIAMKEVDQLKEMLGANLEVLSNDELEKYNVKAGVKITEIKNGILKDKGVPAGFVITKINKNDVTTISDVYRDLNESDGGILMEGVNPDGSKGYYAFGMEQ